MDAPGKSSSYRWVMAFLLLITTFCQMIPYMAPAVIMQEIMADLGVGYGLAGMTIMIMLVMSGICMFAGSAILDKLGTRNTFVLAVWLLCAGNALSFAAGNIGVLLTGRAIVGVGFGICSVCASPFLSTWFDGKKRTYMITANLIANSAAVSISFSLSRPLMVLAGS
jgi:predicted MFS family arabinose efflux permease